MSETLLLPLLAPISEERRGGESLRFDPLYDEVKKLREEDDASLPQGVWQRELKKADWPGVARLSSEALTTRTKDLQIAAWLAEAWIHIDAFIGLARGLRLVEGLCRDFWDDLHPPIGDDGNLDPRLAPIGWMVEKLVMPIKSVRITAPATEDTAPYAWRDWETGQYLIKLAASDSAAATKAQERGMVPNAKFMISVSLTPAVWLAERARDLHAAVTALDALDAVLRERCGEALAPSLTPIRTPLTAIQNFLARVLDERTQRGELPSPASEAPAVPQEESMTVAVDTSTAPQPVAAGGPVASRAEAYQRLREAADYLMRTEPHSPVPYLVRRAVSWGNLSLAELLEELMHKNADLPTIYQLLGIKKT